MKIIVTTPSEALLGERDYRSFCVIEIGDAKLSFYDGEPEDANLGRDFNDVYRITDLLELAYAAGRKDEGIEIVHQTTNDD